MANLQSLTINDTGSLKLPAGTIEERPSFTVTTQSYTTVGTTSWTAPTGVSSIEVLVVAGGGGGGTGGGGGGGGGVIYNNSYPVVPGTSYIVTVGAGGSNTSSWGGAGGQGGNSVFANLTAIGGGAGGHRSANATSFTGGSGGGDAGGPAFGRVLQNNTPGQGYSGGNSIVNGISLGDAFTQEEPGGGGGGAGSPGEDSKMPLDRSNATARAALPGRGGDGLAFSISGTPTRYAGGGGGANRNGVGAAGGLGGGGAGGATGTAGLTNTGGGGGGTGYGPYYSGTNVSGSGGSGIVIIRYAQTQDSIKIRVNSTTGDIEKLSNFSWKSKSNNKNLVTEGLLLYYDGAMYGTGTTCIDLSGNGYHGSIVGSPTIESSTGSFVFNGTNYISGPNLGNWPTKGTVEFWMKPTSVQNYRNPFHSHFQSSNQGIRFELDSSGRFTILVGPAGGGYEFADYLSIGETEADKWYHVVAVWDTTINQVLGYLNGELKFTLPVSSWPTTLPSPTFGNGFSSSPERWFQGNIPTGRIYGRALTGAEVQRNFSAEADRFGLSPIVSYPSANYLWKLKPDLQNGYYWIKKEGQEEAVLTFCDMQTLDENGESGWMLVGNWAQGYTWGGKDVAILSTANTIGLSLINSVSSNFGNHKINMFRVTSTSDIRNLGIQAPADFYYYWKGGITWKEAWSPTPGILRYYLSSGTSPEVQRCALRRFDSSYNLRFRYNNPNHKWNNLTDYGYQNTRIDITDYSYGDVGGNTAPFNGFFDVWTALTTPRQRFEWYYVGRSATYSTRSGGDLDGSLSIPISGAGTSTTGQDVDNNISVKIGVDDNINWGGSATAAGTDAGNNGTINTTPLWWWIK